MTRMIALALLLVTAAPGQAQEAAPPPPQAEAPAPVPAPPPPAPKAETVRVSIQTSEGPITLELEKERAPATTANFLRYVDQKRFDGTTFYRAMKLTEDGKYGIIQGGLQNDPKRLFPPVKHEPTSTTGLSHVDGAISMARGAPDTATADFFITIGDLVSLDANPSQPGDNLGFAVFGHVAEGMDVVRRIMAAPISPTKGEGSMVGQMIDKPITIVSVRRAD